MKKENGITLIALVVTIVVLLILAGVSISMLTGENGIITQAQESKLQTEIGKEKEYITLSVSAIRGEKISKGDTSEITSSELQIEMNKYTDEAKVTGSGTLTVTYESGRSYDVEQNGNITQKEELTPEDAKKIVDAIIEKDWIIFETADETVYFFDDLKMNTMQKIEVTDGNIIAQNGIKEKGDQYFIDNEGKVYTWGDNYYGKLGNGTDEDSDKPICISDIPGNVLNGKNIVKIQESDAIIALDSEGKVYTWGNNKYGNLGNGTDIEYSNEPQCISDITENALNGRNIVYINYRIAIDDKGKVYTWGNNKYGNLGNGTDIEYSNQPQCISDIPGNALNGKLIQKVQEVYDVVVASDVEGKIYTWGYNLYGRLGNGTDIEYSNEPQCISDIPGNVLNGKNIVKIQESDAIIVLDSEGKVYTWGYNKNGNLGNGTDIEYSNEPQCISDISGNALNGKSIQNVQEVMDYVIAAIDDKGKVYTWGNNHYGQLGNGTDENSNKPICISDIQENALNSKSIKDIQEIYYSLIAIDSEGKVYTWGDNINGQLLDGTNEDSYIPICITDNEKSYLYNIRAKSIDTISASGMLRICFVTQEGKLYNYSLDYPV